ncbi:hypothetical protein B484DRAFT_281191 [Ochromonadaceae sp. CCMP2298]|nr:hypothetical protein B484DRAFT_281191 [Ochromonadaceae sp. CCMP2298]
MSEDADQNNWRQFQGTELGSLMSSIYGNKNRPKISYPKPRSKAPTEPKQFIPGGANPNAADPRKVTRTAVTLCVPRPAGNRKENVRPIDVMRGRRAGSTIQVEMEDTKMRMAHYRPAYTQPISAEEEKERLSQICTYKGGKGLPQELTFPAGEMPLEIAARRREQERWEAIKAKRGGGQGATRAPRQVSEGEQMAQLIQGEIEERRSYLQEMRGLGALRPEQERALTNEIARKVQELQAVDM